VASAGVIPRRGLDQYNLFVGINANMLRAYHPSFTYNGPLLLVRSKVLGRTLLSEVDDPKPPYRSLWDFGWSEHVNGSIAVVDVPCDHLSLLKKPAVEYVGRYVSSALA
jgi:thioesterase domain-containing protein